MAMIPRWIHTIAKRKEPHVLHAHLPILNALSELWITRKLGIPMHLPEFLCCNLDSK